MASAAPVMDTDRRILAQARRAIVPATARWWLPASLAASLLLAVLIVQWQLADSGAPAHLGESDVLPTPAAGISGQSVVDAAQEAPAQRRDAPPAPAVELAAPPASMPVPKARMAPVSDEATAAMAAPRNLEQDLARERPFNAKSHAEAAIAPAPPAPAQAESPSAIGKPQMMKSGDSPPAPEEWYARIEALRANGHMQEADEELARLEAAYPGWLERNRQPAP